MKKALVLSLASLSLIISSVVLANSSEDVLTCKDSAGKSYALSIEDRQSAHLSLRDGERVLSEKNGKVEGAGVLFELNVRFTGDDGSELLIGSDGVFGGADISGYVKMDSKSPKVHVNCVAEK